MPVALLRYDPDKVPLVIAAGLARELRNYISEALDVPKNPNARLTYRDIEVSLVKHGKLDPNTKDLEVMVWAHSYPERLRNLEERKDEIVAKVKKYLKKNRWKAEGWVWVLLQPSAFGKI